VRVGPVPFTLQTAFVLLAGLLLRPGWAATSMGLYLLLGAIGLPVFSAGQGGLAALAGPTGGFLLAFPAAAAALAAIRVRGTGDGATARRTLAADAGGIIVAELVIYALGLPWLMYTTGMGLSQAFAVAVAPFLIPDAFKAFAAIVVAGAVRRARG
jgi:biotin transport system substrate-specific component